MLRERVTLVWVGLVAATCLTTWGLGKDALDPAVAVVGVLLLAGVKVVFVMLDFMELRDAPRGPRRAFLLWPVVVVAVALGFWFAT